MTEERCLKWRRNESLMIIFFSALSGGVFFLLPFWLPAFFGLVSVVSLFSPLPLLCATRSLGRAKGFFTVLLTTGMIAFLDEPLTGLQFFFEFGILTLILSVVLEQEVPIEKAISYTAFLTFFVMASVGFVYAVHSSIGVLDGLRQWIDTMVTQVVDTLEKSKVPHEHVKILQDAQDVLVERVLSLSPSLVLGFLSIISFVNIILMNRVLPVFKGAALNLGDLTRWRSPDKLIWCLLASGFCILFNVKGLSIIAWNVFVLLVLMYFFQGLSIVGHFFRTRKVPRFIEVMFYFLLITQLPLAVLVAITGLFDLWVNFRKL